MAQIETISKKAEVNPTVSRIPLSERMGPGAATFYTFDLGRITCTFFASFF